MIEVGIRGVNIKIDEEDLPLVKSKNWHLSKADAKRGYYYFKWVEYGGAKPILHLLHREIANVPKGSKLVVDHIDRDTTNNTRANLRIVTRAENTVNTGPKQNKNSSKYKGAYYNKHVGKFKAELVIKGKSYFLGYWDTEEEAAEKYDIYSKYIYGDIACLNFPDKSYTQEQLDAILTFLNSSTWKHNTSGYNCVFPKKRKNGIKYQPMVQWENKRTYLGYFNTALEAYIARCKYLDEHPEIKVRR